MMAKYKAVMFRIVLSAVLLVAAVVLRTVLSLAAYQELLLFIVIYGLIGYDIVRDAISGIGRGQIFDENFLMVLATVGAFAIAEYPEAVAVMLLYQIGELFQKYAVDRSRGSISGLMELRPDSARKLVDGEEVICDPAEVEVGQMILVKAGERVPLDGIVFSGHSILDTSALTGESMPRSCGPEDEILSGVIVMSGVLQIRVTKAFYDSTVSKILDMVENVSGKKARSERFITKFARYYTPIVVVLALLQALVPPMLDGQWTYWFQNAMNFLVVSCPCALVISVPLGFYCGIGAASKEGVLVKGGNDLEQLAKVNHFVFDKTGTLTGGKFQIIQVVPEKHREQILQAAAIAESGSMHPIAQSILDVTGEAVHHAWEIETVSGLGVKASRGDQVILVGNQQLLQNAGINADILDTCATVVYVAENGRYLGAIVIADELKDDTVSAIAELHAMGAKTVMLTGDHRGSAAAIAEKAGITRYEAELLPSDKVAAVEQIMDGLKKRDVLAFVGDGINDAPVLMRADCGIAMGGIGSDAAIEAADVVLMHDRLSAIPLAQKIARKTMSIVRQNIVFALGIKLAVLALTPFGLVSIWLAIFADVGVAMLAILNAMRAGRGVRNDHNGGDSG